MSDKTGFTDIENRPIRVGDIVRYTEDDYEELYTVKSVGRRFLLVSHEDSEYNAWLEDVGPLEIVSDKENSK